MTHACFLKSIPKIYMIICMGDLKSFAEPSFRGCTATVALAEQGADVTAIDVHQASLRVAEDRCRIYDLKVNLVCANATEVHSLFRGKHFDFVIFFACLEHMTHQERMAAMRHTWDILLPGSYWCVVDTPNRLWYYDGHTALLLFYLWLPDDLALLYARFSPRASLRNRYRETDERSGGDSSLDLLRRGREVSFHEFDLTLGSVGELDVVSSLSLFLRKENILRNAAWKLSVEGHFESFLAKAGPRIHRGFYQPSLDLIIRKH